VFLDISSFKAAVKRFRNKTFIVYISLFILLIGAYLCLSLIYGYSFPNGVLVRDPFLFVCSILATVGILYSAIRSAGEKWYIHIPWLLFSFAYLIDNLSTTLQVLFKQSTLYNFPGFLILASYTLIAIGIAFLPSTPRPAGPRPKHFFDMVIVISLLLAGAWILLIIPLIFFKQPLYDQAFTAVTYIMIFAVFDLLLRRRKNSNHTVSTLMCISIGMTAIGEIVLAIQRSNALIWVNVIMNLCWFISYASIGFAGLSVEFSNNPLQRDLSQVKNDREYRFDFLLPALWAGFMYVLLIWSHYSPDIIPFNVLSIGTGSLLIILLIRFNETLKENARLISEAKMEIDSRRKMQDKFWHDSRHDGLTTLPNRSFLVDQLQVAIETANETNKINSALFFLDLDRFKTINDSYGHTIGDQFLKAVSERLIFCMRPDDFVARLGGDEFAIILNNLQSSQAVYKVAARIMDKMKEPFDIQGNSIISGVSFGICYIHPGFDSPDEILKESDKAMYVAKRKGRGRFETSKMYEF
jgi:diguanylate cyclase (GGDEF)-like protein